MARGRTGFEILKSIVTGEKQVPTEQQYHNPLQAKVGAHVRLANIVIDGKDYTHDLWDVTQIWAWNRRINGAMHPFADYILESDGRRLVLRVMPNQNRGKAAEPELLLLSQYYPDNMVGPLPWGDESPFILEAIMDPTGEFVRFKGEPTEEKYFRDLSKIPADVAILRDKDGNGTVDADEVERHPHTLWTFRRDTEDEAKQKFTQHLHVQLSGTFHPSPTNNQVVGGDKDILMLRGEAIPALNVMMY
jgi:hypothetical protein